MDAVFVLTAEQEAGEAATDQGIADARERAASIAEELAAGGDAAELAETYGPASTDSAWITAGADIGSAEWAEVIYAAEAGGSVAEIIEAPTGEQLVALVSQVIPETPDEGFSEAVKDAVGEDVHRRNVELETIADKLEQRITDEALAAEYEQVLLGRTLVERNPVTADDSAGRRPAPATSSTCPRRPLTRKGNVHSAGPLCPSTIPPGLRHRPRPGGRLQCTSPRSRTWMSAPRPSPSAPSPRATVPAPRGVATSAGSRSRT